jgi:hypothetical protein
MINPNTMKPIPIQNIKISTREHLKRIGVKKMICSICHKEYDEIFVELHDLTDCLDCGGGLIYDYN